MAWPRPQRSGGGLKYPAGEYRTQAQLEALPPLANRTRDEYQADVSPFQPVGVSRWLRIRGAMGDREFLEAGQEQSVGVFQVNLRHVVGMTTDMRWRLLDGRILNIETVYDIDEKHYEDELRCVEDNRAQAT